MNAGISCKYDICFKYLKINFNKIKHGEGKWEKRIQMNLPKGNFQGEHF